jgi:hypothetical protein
MEEVLKNVTSELHVSLTHTVIQGGSDMTGTNCDLFTHSQSRSYLNHLVLLLPRPVSVQFASSSAGCSRLYHLKLCRHLVHKCIHLIECMYEPNGDRLFKL